MHLLVTNQPPQLIGWRFRATRHAWRTNQMDAALLAQYMGLPRWRVWLHLRPWGFKRLTAPQLASYAAMLRTSVAQLQDISLVGEMQIPGRDRNNHAD